MNRRVRLGRLGGVTLYAHWSLVLIVFYAVFASSPVGVTGWLVAFALLVILFVSVVLHEWAHMLVARTHGLPVEELVLWPLGGLTAFAEPDQWFQRVMIRVAGPLANGLLALLATLLMPLLIPDGEASTSTIGALLRWTRTINVALLGLNLLPAVPLDGGRIVQALLTLILGPERAEQWAALLALAIAAAIVVVGLLANNIEIAIIGLLIGLVSATLPVGLWRAVRKRTQRTRER